MWYRVFGTADTSLDPAPLLEQLRGVEGLEVTGHFRGDEQGWFAAELQFPEGALQIERYLASEEGIRAELNTWAAWVEARGEGPVELGLMGALIRTAQLFTLQPPADGPSWRNLCDRLCRFFASRTGGIYQADGQGFFAADGSLLLGES